MACKGSSRRRAPTPRAAMVFYLLRVWREGGKEGAAVRAALKARRNGEWVGFASPEALVEALRAEMEERESGEL